MDIEDLFARARQHDTRAVSKLLTLAESTDTFHSELGPMLAGSAASRTHIVGITGSPGTGKSMLTSALISAYRGRGLRVAVLAVDPSSPYTGGALLGDRIRMLEHSDDDGVFIRSMASRGHLGGLATASMTAISILSTTGFDILLIETVGAGQSEIEVVEVSDTTIVVVNPNAGDGIQAVKAGIFEIADIFVVNKADHPNADLTVQEIRGALRLSRRRAADWVTPVVRSIAVAAGGVEEVVDAIEKHQSWLDGGARAQRRHAFTAKAIRRLAIDEFDRRLRLPDDLVDRVQRGELGIWEAALSLANGYGCSVQEEG
jgi:LAO/AO transport system kinase